ncbi:hypothetical protein [Celerinatantimonas sp. MCCC 1A17872]|uniref:hypothetical protein n=1 Tax=Celerinatantimonas sp. MCCC 1A17872 TaxID=3177514 RepID=UPI0038C38A79
MKSQLLVQSMHWANLCWESSNKSIIELDEILPKIGQSYKIKLSQEEDYVGVGSVLILWKPPHSEQNMWDDLRPSEIRRSYVLNGDICNVSTDKMTFDFHLNEKIPLVEFFSRQEEVLSSPLPYVGPIHRLKWQDAHHVCHYHFDNYYYISGVECESFLEVILSIENDKWCIHYSADLPNCSFYRTFITRYYLDEHEQKIFKELLSKSTAIEDTSLNELGKTQVHGLL